MPRTVSPHQNDNVPPAPTNTDPTIHDGDPSVLLAYSLFSLSGLLIGLLLGWLIWH
jgi:hypothetical protein